MDQVNFGYSTKNIPIPEKQDYIERLILQTTKFAKMAKWKAVHYLNETRNRNKKETFGFSTTAPVPPVPELKQLEDELNSMIEKVTFKDEKATSIFQRKLKQDCNTIKIDKQLIKPVTSIKWT